MKKLLSVLPNTKKNSPEDLELLRLDCFREMLHSVGLRTGLTWQGTCYSLCILRKGMLWRWRTVQTLSREIDPTKPFAAHEWKPPIDCHTESALTSMYRGALECALGARHISLELP